MKEEKALRAAIAAAIAQYLEAEAAVVEEVMEKVRPQLSPYALSGRQIIMNNRMLWQLRIPKH